MGAGVTGSGTKSLTINGSRGQVKADLATLIVPAGTTIPDSTAIKVQTCVLKIAAQQTIAVTVNGLPVIAVPGPVTVGVGKQFAIAGVSLSETGNTVGETFTVTDRKSDV